MAPTKISDLLGKSTMDEYQLGKDFGSLEARVRALEEHIQTHKHGCGCGGKKTPTDLTQGYKLLGVAEITTEPADPTITMKPDTDADAREACSVEGMTRAKYVDGVCYCQMCCGGQWNYFCYDNGYCIHCPGGVTVNCNGTNRQLKC
jgi:hypothetical protein